MLNGERVIVEPQASDRRTARLSLAFDPSTRHRSEVIVPFMNPRIKEGIWLLVIRIDSGGAYALGQVAAGTRPREVELVIYQMSLVRGEIGLRPNVLSIVEG